MQTYHSEKTSMELSTLEVNVLQECQVSPPSASVPSTSLPLSYFDLIFLGRPLNQFLIYYQYHNTKTHFINTIVPKIKQSFSLALQRFFPLAGKLIWRKESTKPELFYEDGDAVQFIVAESDQEFSEFSGNHARDPNGFYPLSPVPFRWRKSSEDHTFVPLFALQVTLFPNQGICFGGTFNHVAADARTMLHFMKTLASFCRLEGDSPPPYYNRSSIINHLQPNELIYLNQQEKFNITKHTFHSLTADHMVPSNINVQATFVMGRACIKRLSHLVSAHVAKEYLVRPLHLSSFVITCAYAWVCMVKARWGEDLTGGSGDAKEYLIVPVDARARLDPPLPVTYYGNCVVALDIMAMRSGLVGEDGIAIAAMLIARGIQNFDVNEQIAKPLSHYLSMPPEQCLVVAGSPKVGAYDIDFGWGKPKKVELTLLATGNSMCIIESPNEAGALEIGLCVNTNMLNAFASLFRRSLPPLSSM